jgi:probable rRNA maturation factor
MAIELEVQIATAEESLPDKEHFERGVTTALGDRDGIELTVRLVGKEESRQLNSKYRGRNSATNVLSFPAELPAALDLPLLGDIVICAPVVAEEARQQDKLPANHWAHMTIHGVLHLLGFDHQEEGAAKEMEMIEIEMLTSLGIPNPYSQ